MTRRLCIELHDVAPATWPRCRRLLDRLDAVGGPPVTLLVVPDYHGFGPLRATPAFVAQVAERIARGDEVALHGYFHRDDAPAPTTPWGWLRRRVLTAGEGEFAAIGLDDASQRIARGCAEFAALAWPVRGFVAPAWLGNAATWTALRASPLRYAATRNALVSLDGMTPLHAPAICVSARTRWRRVAGRLWVNALCRLTFARPLVRVALHPVDAEHPTVMDDWTRALRLLLAQRRPLTTSQALGLD